MSFRSFIIFLSLALPLAVSAQEEAPAFSIADVNDAAAFLAGVDLPHRTDHPLTETSSWKTHKTEMEREFTSHQERVLFPMTEWSNSELAPITHDKLVRYMFSGPDILHAYYMFPGAETYIMCGLEPVGEMPSIDMITTSNAGRALGEVRNALGEIINFSFFRTKDMKDDLQFATFRGTTPIMSIFLARSGQYLKSVEFFDLQKDGTLKAQAQTPKGANVVKIEFSPLRVQNTKTLYYFSSDLSNGGFDSTGFKTWLEGQPKGYAYLKAASFLMHDSWFSKIREHLLEYSLQVVEDDSGIPFRYFDPEIWQANLYGTYTGPIDLFAEYPQADLRSAYRQRSLPLDFGTGYKWRKGESNLMRYVKKDAIVEKPAPEEAPAEAPAETETKTESEKESTDSPAL
ncbi:MAG: hypothetical protein CMO55_03550 [Verrucomicrobiales bacterium]|nr:hypothetical protein [Verrucomicrobiales bacterium]